MFDVCRRLVASTSWAVFYTLPFVFAHLGLEVLFGDEFEGFFTCWVPCCRCVKVALDDN